MRVFLAGATGAIGVRLLPLLVGAGHEVAALTRSTEKAPQLAAVGAQPLVCDVFDAGQLADAVASARPDLVVHQLTDLPDEFEQIPTFTERNNRVRTEGTRNLLAAAATAGATRFLAQSIAWSAPGTGAAVAEHERLVLGAGGVVIRYGRFHGPGTYHAAELPAPPRIHVDGAARRTLALLDAPSGIVVIADRTGR